MFTAATPVWATLAAVCVCAAACWFIVRRVDRQFRQVGEFISEVLAPSSAEVSFDVSEAVTERFERPYELTPREDQSRSWW